MMLALAGGASGQSARDLGQGTCADYLGLPRTDRDQLGLWLHGYFSGAAQRPEIDGALLQKAIATLPGLCEAQPALRLMGSEIRALFLLGEVPVAGASPGQGQAPAGDGVGRTIPVPQ